MKHKQWENTTKILKYNERKQIFLYSMLGLYWINMTCIYVLYIILYNNENTNQFRRIAKFKSEFLFSRINCKGNYLITILNEWEYMHKTRNWKWLGWVQFNWFLYQLPFSFTEILITIHQVKTTLVTVHNEIRKEFEPFF